MDTDCPLRKQWLAELEQHLIPDLARLVGEYSVPLLSTFEVVPGGEVRDYTLAHHCSCALSLFDIALFDMDEWLLLTVYGSFEALELHHIPTKLEPLAALETVFRGRKIEDVPCESLEQPPYYNYDESLCRSLEVDPFKDV